MNRARCVACGFELWIPIADLRCSTLGLYNDARFPGRCLLSFNEHAETLEDLDRKQAQSWMLDLKVASAVIKGVTGAQRVNLAILGNAEPHLHAHLIPRIPNNDPIPTQSPWDHPLPSIPLEPYLIDELVAHLKNELEPASPQAVKTGL